MIELGSETNSKGFYKFMNRANKAMDEIQNSNGAFEAMMTISASLK